MAVNNNKIAEVWKRNVTSAGGPMSFLRDLPGIAQRARGGGSSPIPPAGEGLAGIRDTLQRRRSPLASQILRGEQRAGDVAQSIAAESLRTGTAKRARTEGPIIDIDPDGSVHVNSGGGSGAASHGVGATGTTDGAAKIVRGSGIPFGQYPVFPVYDQNGNMVAVSVQTPNGDVTADWQEAIDLGADPGTLESLQNAARTGSGNINVPGSEPIGVVGGAGPDFEPDFEPDDTTVTEQPLFSVDPSLISTINEQSRIALANLNAYTKSQGDAIRRRLAETGGFGSEVTYRNYLGQLDRDQINNMVQNFRDAEFNRLSMTATEIVRAQNLNFELLANVILPGMTENERAVLSGSLLGQALIGAGVDPELVAEMQPHFDRIAVSANINLDVAGMKNPDNTWIDGTKYDDVFQIVRRHMAAIYGEEQADQRAQDWMDFNFSESSVDESRTTALQNLATEWGLNSLQTQSWNSFVDNLLAGNFDAVSIRSDSRPLVATPEGDQWWESSDGQTWLYGAVLSFIRNNDEDNLFSGTGSGDPREGYAQSITQSILNILRGGNA